MTTKDELIYSRNQFFKISRYTHVIIDSDSCLLYNAKSNSLAKVPSEVGNAILNKDYDLLAKFMNHEGLSNKLTEGQFIVMSETDEVQDVLQNHKDLYRKGSWVGFTIVPTTDCNFACPYCFEPKVPPKYMNDRIADKVLSFIERKLDDKSWLSLVWFGYEPTLAVDRIEYLTRHIDKLINGRGINANSEIITNGYNLGPKVIQRLNDCHIGRYQITLDGPPRIHNSRRFPTKGGTSFEIILKNIKLIMMDAKVDIRVNIDSSNANYIDELMDILSEEGILDHCGVCFARVDAITNASKAYAKKCFSMKDFAYECVNIYSRQIKRIQPFYPWPPFSCSALGPNMFVIDPLGKIYRCWTAIEDPNECIGSVDSPDALRCNDTISSFFIDQDPKCLDCNILPICLGSCPFKFVVSKDSEDRCTRWKYNLHDMLKLQMQWIKIRVQSMG